MRRLVYAPKAYVFVRSNTQGGKIYNLSPDVVSGNVSRKVNDVSTAEVVLRNRFRKWLKDPDNGMSILMPMDMITIWLQRIAGKPIQVFTGYLDSVPYYQMYPGNCTITATCTLKRLAYSWFDPGLEWFQNWFNGIGGWAIINPETGEVRNLNAVQGTTADNRMKINDGGFADLIQRFMIDIAGWSPDNIIISDLPSSIPKVASQLYARIQKENEITQAAVEQLMSNIIGISASPVTAANQDMQSHQNQTLIRSIKKVASDKNIPLVIPITAALMATGMRPSYAKQRDRATSDNDWGYGLYAMKPPVHAERDHRSNGGTINVEGDTIGGVNKSKISNPTTATQVFLSRMQRVNVDPFSTGARRHNANKFDGALRGDTTAMRGWINEALNRSFSVDDFQGAYNQAKAAIRAYDHPGSASQGDAVQGAPTPTGLSWASVSAGQGQDMGVMDSVDYKVFAKSYRQANDSLTPYYWMAKKNYTGIHLHNPGQPSTSTLVLGGSASDLQSYFDSVKNHNEYDTITLSKTAGNATTLTTYKSGRKSGVSHVPSAGSGAVGSQVILQVKANAEYPSWTFAASQITAGSGAQDVTANSTNSTTASQFSVQDIGKIGFASAFLAHFALSANWMEAQYLTGYKALANDQSCFDGIKQFCQSSLRSFMSLPDGKFVAFYPDYFGAHGRKPYWYIYDIEITNGGVALSDEQLATHVYTIGDTFANDEQITEMDYIRSAGVVTIDMGILEGFIRPLEGQKDNTHGSGQGAENMGVIKTAADFVYHYGARPYKEEVPMIRNQYFEFLYAWQRFMQKWAATFQTTIEFTFQPEVMAGGILGFPQHNLQMYVEDVTHTWDYASGFNTQATLSSPAAMSATKSGDIGSLPGFALAGNLNSVGTPAG